MCLTTKLFHVLCTMFTGTPNVMGMLHFDESYVCNSTELIVKGVPVVTFNGVFTNAKGQDLSMSYYWGYDAGHSYPVAAVMKAGYQ